MTPKFPPEFRRDFFGEESVPSVRAAALDTAGAYQSFAFISGGVIHQLSFPSLKTKTRPSGGLFVGSISDELDNPQLVTLPGELRDPWIVTAVFTLEVNYDAMDIDYFPTLTKMKPDLVPGPFADDGNGSVGRGPPGLECLGSEIEMCFAVLPVLLPIPRGINIPTPHPLKDSFEQDVLEVFPVIETWRLAMQWQEEMMGGLSCHHRKNGVFEPSYLDVHSDLLAHFVLAPENVCCTGVNFMPVRPEMTSPG
jgi:hypothetical protein